MVIFWLKISCGVSYQVLGRENIQAVKQPCMVLSKHQSAWETLFLQGLFWPSSTILKKELLNIPFFGWGLRALYPIAIDRSNPRAALRQVKTKGVEHLQAGFNIILFPEGTRMQLGERGTYARSGADIALDGNVDILPVALDAARCWPPKSFIKKPGIITVSVGSAIKVEGKSSKEVTKEVENWIEGEMEAILKKN